MGKIANAIRGTALAIDKQAEMLALDREFVEMEAKIKHLEAQVLHLEAKVKPLEREVERLKKEAEKPAARESDHLDEMAEKILQAIANSDGRMPKRATAAHFGLSQARGNLCFDLLWERSYIRQTSAMRDPTFAATTEGLKYLQKKGLIK